MTPIADMVRRLHKAGCSIEQIAVEIEAREIESVERDAARREKERIRKRNQRARPQESQGQPGTARDNQPPNTMDVDPRARARLPKKETTSEVSHETSSVVRASRLPNDWKPSEADFEYAHSKGLPHARIAIEAEKFRNYWTAKPGGKATSVNWPRNWQTWILNAVDWSGNEQRSSTVQSAKHSAVVTGISRAFTNRNGGVAGPADEEIPRGRYELDLEPEGRSRKI